LLITVTAYYRGYIVGKEHPREQRTFIVYTLITFAFVTSLVAYQPAAGLLLFVLPMIVGLFITAWTTYDHHAGLNTENEFEASFNNVNRWYNLFTGNLGYHTAHHYKQGLHWSKLPQLHDKIKDNIPEKLIQRTWI
jgi:fatty acid desaturase